MVAHPVPRPSHIPRPLALQPITEVAAQANVERLVQPAWPARDLMRRPGHRLAPNSKRRAEPFARSTATTIATPIMTPTTRNAPGRLHTCRQAMRNTGLAVFTFSTTRLTCRSSTVICFRPVWPEGRIGMALTPRLIADQPPVVQVRHASARRRILGMSRHEEGLAQVASVPTAGQARIRPCPRPGCRSARISSGSWTRARATSCCSPPLNLSG